MRPHDQCHRETSEKEPRLVRLRGHAQGKNTLRRRPTSRPIIAYPLRGHNHLPPPPNAPIPVRLEISRQISPRKAPWLPGRPCLSTLNSRPFGWPSDSSSSKNLAQEIPLSAGSPLPLDPQPSTFRVPIRFEVSKDRPSDPFLASDLWLLASVSSLALECQLAAPDFWRDIQHLYIIYWHNVKIFSLHFHRFFGAGRAAEEMAHYWLKHLR